jgi:hypothetical protein
VKRAAPKDTDLQHDPFGERGERGGRRLRWSARVLGAKFEFTSNSRALLQVAQDAFAGVPQHRWPRAARPTLRISLTHLRDRGAADWVKPPKPVLSSGPGVLCAHVDARNFMIVNEGAAHALIQVTDSMLRHRDLVRYELIEFAAITLATRAQELVSLHAGCVGSDGRGVLLLGGSGSGKSTLALHAALEGLDFLAEDSVFVQPRTLRATGLSAFVHAREDALDLITDRAARRTVHRAPRIQRRSGVRKCEIDLRRGMARLAPVPLRIVTTVVLSARPERGAATLVPLTTAQLRRVLRAEQAFAVDRPGWSQFERQVLQAGGFRLRRVPPADGVSSLRALLSRKAA